MTKKELKEMVKYQMSLRQDLPRKLKKHHKKCFNQFVKDMMKNDLYSKMKSIYPFIMQ